MSSANPIDTTAAEAYEKHMVPGMFLHWTERLVAVAAPEPGEHVLDVACGTGIGARLAARAVGAAGRVVGLDIDPGVVEVGRRVMEGSTTPMEWQCGSALKMPFKDGEFDLCLCLQGLQFVPDRLARASPRSAAFCSHRAGSSRTFGGLLNSTKGITRWFRRSSVRTLTLPLQSGPARSLTRMRFV